MKHTEVHNIPKHVPMCRQMKRSHIQFEHLKTKEGLAQSKKEHIEQTSSTFQETTIGHFSEPLEQLCELLLSHPRRQIVHVELILQRTDTQKRTTAEMNKIANK